jgi:hypothetical protein
MAKDAKLGGEGELFPRGHGGTIQGPFRDHSGTIQGTIQGPLMDQGILERNDL